jgi:predicted secreted hydrolase
MRLLIIFIILMIASGVAVARLDRLDSGGIISAGVDELAFKEDTQGFARAYNPIPITFPADLGQHPDYRLEWWYYTGNLADAQGNRYGFQLTFFRRGLSPGLAARASEWGSNQIYFAHFTLTDVTGNSFNFDERFSRGSPGLAGAQGSPYRVWLDNWQATETGPGQVRLTATAADMALDLTLEQVKPVVLHGDRGLSQKAGAPGNASYYYSLTRNRAGGMITTPRGAFNVTGLVWKDHEWSTSSLGEDAVGWDWFSLQLDDGREIMVAYLRKADNSAEPVSGGTLIETDGTARSLSLADVNITVLNTWTSPESGATYPAEWQLAIPAYGIDVRLKPLLPQQELRVSTTYWEGAVKAEGTQQGYGYVELTGYAGSIQGRM